MHSLREQRRIRNTLPIAGLACFLIVFGTLDAPANPIGVAAGRLTCTAEAKSAGRRLAPRDLTCRLQRVSGRPATYTGIVTGYGRDSLARGKLVLTWTVIAPRAHVRPGDLAGRYRSARRGSVVRPGSRGERGLVGGSNGTIVLKPLAAGAAAADPSIQELELRLAPTRT
jgi:hypothetical protein